MEIDLTEIIKTYYVYAIFAAIIIGAILWNKYKKKKPPKEEPWIPPPPKELIEESRREEGRLYNIGDISIKIKEYEDKREQILTEAKRLKDSMEKSKDKLRKELKKIEEDGYYNSMFLKMRKDEVENQIVFLKEFEKLPKK